MKSQSRRLTRTLAPVTLLATGLLSVGCVDNNPASDARGNYSLEYDNQLTIRFKLGGAVQEQTAGSDDVVTFETDSGPVSIDLGAFCARDDVTCPSESLWTEVSVDQPNIEAQNPNTHVVNFINNMDRDLEPGQRAQVISGLVDDRDRFGLLIDAQRAGQGDCGLLAISTAGGRFSHEGERLEEVPQEDAGVVDSDGGADGIEGAPRTRLVWDDGAPVVGIEEGKVKLGFLGACAFGPALVAATLEIETGFVGARIGDFDPPPYIPVDPADVDAGLANPSSDGGVPDDDGGLPPPDAGPFDAGPIDAGAPVPDDAGLPDAGGFGEG